MIVRELVLGPKRFTDLRAGLPHASPNVLSERLRELEAAGVVRRRTLPPPAASRVYELTEWGAELEHVLDALGRWGARAPNAPEDCGMSPDAHLLSLRTLFDPSLAGDFATSLDIHLGDERFRARVADGELELERGEAAEPDAVVTTDHATLLALAHRRAELERRPGGGRRSRSPATRTPWRASCGLFTLPEPAPVEGP